MEIESRPAETVRGTQSFVHTMTACWKRPSLTALEVAWRWAYGAPAAALLTYEGLRVWHAEPVDVGALQRMTISDPMGTAVTLSQAGALLMPPILHAAEWVAPLLLMVWVVASAVGRTAVLRRVDAELQSRPGTLIVLQALRVAALAASFAVWFACVRAAGDYEVNGPILAGREPNLVGYCALVIVATLGMFTLWAVVSWALSVAPLLAMRLDLGAGASLREAFRLGPLRAKLVEINLVLGIVKMMLIVLAMAFSACPLPFAAVATQGFMVRWYAFVTLLYLLASDFFHVVQLVSYLELWKAYEGGA